jgi:preprotein translocase subunit YajC
LPVVLLAVFYLLLIRPQQKRQKELRALVDAVKTGDEVVTSGGILGRVSRVNDQYLTLEVSQSGNSPVELTVQKSSVQTVLPKGTLKAI